MATPPYHDLGEKICEPVVFSGPPVTLPTTAAGKVDQKAIVKKLGS